MDKLSQHYRNQFYQEAREILDQANDDLMRAEADPENTELLNSIFRGIHTIKGSAGSFDLDAISEFAHHLESILNCLREGRLALTSELVDASLFAFDQLNTLIDAYSSNKEAKVSQEAVSMLQVFLDQSGKTGDEAGDCLIVEENAVSAPVVFQFDDGSPAEFLQQFQDAVDQGFQLYKVSIRYGGQHMVHGYDPLVLLRNLKESSLSYMAVSAGRDIPGLDRFEPLDLYLEPVVYLGSGLSAEALLDLAFDPELMAIERLALPGGPQSGFSGSSDLWPDLPEHVRRDLNAQAAKGLPIYRLGLGYDNEHLEHGYDPLVLLRNLRRTSSYYHCNDSGAELPCLRDFEPLHLYLAPTILMATPLNVEQLEDMTFERGLLAVEVIQTAPAGSSLAETGLDIDPEDMEEFLTGSSELLDKYEEAAMAYEAQGNQSFLNEIFRAVHTIKGDSDYLGLKELTMFSHALESMLEQLRAGKVARGPETGDILLQSGDFLRQNLVALKKGRFIAELPPVFSKLIRFLNPEDAAARDLPKPSGYSSDLGQVFIEQANQKTEMLKSLEKKKEWSDFDRGNVRRSLAGLGNAARTVGLAALRQSIEKSLEAFDCIREQELREKISDIISFFEGLIAEPKRIGEILVEEGKISEQDLQASLDRQKPLGAILVESGKVSDEDLQRALNKQNIMESARQACSTAAPEPEVRTMRVDESKIDQFGNFIGELLVVRNTNEYLVKQLDDLQGLNEETLKAFRENQHLLTRLTNDIHHGIMALRMIPIRGTFQRFQRVVRDISRKQKKDIQYITDGDDLEIDKKVADSLADPLIHLVRNACDHGIETAARRREAGKPEKATVRLTAGQEGSNLIIRVADDGQGIDRGKLLEKVRQAGYRPPGLDDPGLLDYIFMPGLSTRDEVTDVSGRGVGMDVVKTAVQSLNGTVMVQSEMRLGTEVTLTIPMTMGISAVLVVEAGPSVYALPLDSVLETLRVSSEKFRRAGRQLVVHNRGRVIVVSRLEHLLDNNGLEEISPCTLGDGEQLMVVVDTPAGQIGLIVDRLVGNMELAVKPVPTALAHLKLYSGVSLLGDGKVIFILNPDRVLMNG